MDQSTDETSPKTIDLGTVQNLDTARMALRWALERIRSLERENSAQAASQKKSEEEISSLKMGIAKLQFEANGLQLQYERLKKLLAMRPEELKSAGKVQLEALDAKGKELQHFQETLEQRKTRLEEQHKTRLLELEAAERIAAAKAIEVFAARKAEIEQECGRRLAALDAKGKELQDLREALEQRKIRQEQEQTEVLAARQAELERECRHRLAALPEREARVKQEELDLAERQKRLDEYAAAVRSQLELDAKDFRAQAEEAARLRDESRQRYEALCREWAEEKKSLLRELEEHRRRAREPFPPNPELEDRLIKAEEEIRLTKKAQSAAEQRVRFAEIERESALSLVNQFEQELPNQIRRITELAKAFPQKVAELHEEHLWAKEKQELIKMLQSQEENLRSLQEQLRAARKTALESSIQSLPAKSQAELDGPGRGQETAPLAPLDAAARPRPLKTAKMESDLLGSQRQLAAEVYGSAVTVIRCLSTDVGLELAGAQPASAADLPRGAVQRILDLLQSDNQALVARASHSAADNGPYTQSVNVAILSACMGLGMRWEQDRLHTLALAAMLCDLDIKRASLDYFCNAEAAMMQRVSEIIAAEQNRKKGLGLPKQSQVIQEEAQIIGLCSLYESMIHSLSPGAAMMPSAAVKVLIKNHVSDFSRPIMQVFVQRITPYPPGSFVTLADGEIACVIGTHPDFPTRPRVEIQLKADLTPQEPALIVDLAENPTIQLRGPWSPKSGAKQP